MKAYFWTNMYLSPIQKGIQCQHCTVEMFLKYQQKSKQKDILFKWAKNHKTTIIFDGGPNDRLTEILATVLNCDFPFAYFEEGGLNGVLTCVGMVVPFQNYTSANLINSSKLAI